MAVPQEPPPAFVHALRPRTDQDAILIVVGGRIERSDASRLADLVRDLLAGGGGRLAICDVGMVDRPGAAAVDLLCRIRLITRRMGLGIEIRGASRELSELLFLMGLCDVVPVARSGGHVERQPKEREHPRGIEEERDPTDPPV